MEGGFGEVNYAKWTEPGGKVVDVAIKTFKVS